MSKMAIIVQISGPRGSGKTTLADRIRRLLIEDGKTVFMQTHPAKGPPTFVKNSPEPPPVFDVIIQDYE
jgi:molybdopterin-guanine dinucleotide biosynthesis protein